MILADTSVWIDHLRRGNDAFAGLLDQGEVLMHPFVIGEIALGHLRQREMILAALDALPRTVVASDPEVLRFIDQQRLFGMGISYVDAHLLAAARLTTGTKLWTRDAGLRVAAERLGLMH